MTGIEKKTGYIFTDPNLLEMALTHSSFSREGTGRLQCNERLEFIGDAFLDAIIGEKLYHMFPDKGEGFLSKARASLVCEKTLAAVARAMGMGDYLKLGRGENRTGGRNRSSILADAVEAVIGAAYLDGGYDAADTIVTKLLAEEIEKIREGRFTVADYKTALQENLQAAGVSIGKVKYIDIAQSGPDHDKVFTVRLEIDGKAEAEGSGKSKKQAQQECARQALMRRQNAL